MSTSHEPGWVPVPHQPPDGQSPYGRGGGYPGRRMPVSDEETNWAVGAHLSGFVAAWFALGFVGPLVVLVAAGNRSPFIRRHAIEAINFNLSVLIYAVISTILIFVLIGILLLPMVALLYLICTISAAVAASRGAEFRYPLTIRFLKP
jgi:uncharacterized Tic20 family protein